jgi:hypothetical protein
MIRIEGAFMECSACKQPYHPDSGYQLSAKTKLCGSCYLSLRKFYLRQMKRGSSGGFRLADAAESSVRAV